MLAIRHLKATLCSSFLKDIFEDTTDYLRELLEAAAKHGLDPNRLIGEHRTTFEANELLACKNWDAVVKLVSHSVFRKLENERSTIDLRQKMNAKLNLGVDPAKIQAALPYLELRHLLVHAGGVADQKYCNSFPAMGATVGHKVTLDYTVLQAARTNIFALVEEYDAKAVQHSVVPNQDLQP